MRRYRVLLPLTVHFPDGAYSQGEEFDHEFSEEDEAANLASGLLELLPHLYRVIGGSNVHGADPGETFEMALPMGQEALLIQGGHIEHIRRVPDREPPASKPTPPKSKEK